MAHDTCIASWNVIIKSAAIFFVRDFDVMFALQCRVLIRTVLSQPAVCWAYQNEDIPGAHVSPMRFTSEMNFWSVTRIEEGAEAPAWAAGVWSSGE